MWVPVYHGDGVGVPSLREPHVRPTYFPEEEDPWLFEQAIRDAHQGVIEDLGFSGLLDLEHRTDGPAIHIDGELRWRR